MGHGFIVGRGDAPSVGAPVELHFSSTHTFPPPQSAFSLQAVPVSAMQAE
jgi:hypothetical protein